jgi:hypothetical protein
VELHETGGTAPVGRALGLAHNEHCVWRNGSMAARILAKRLNRVNHLGRVSGRNERLPVDAYCAQCVAQIDGKQFIGLAVSGNDRAELLAYAVP